MEVVRIIRGNAAWAPLRVPTAYSFVLLFRCHLDSECFGAALDGFVDVSLKCVDGDLKGIGIVGEGEVVGVVVGAVVLDHDVGDSGLEDEGVTVGGNDVIEAGGDDGVLDSRHGDGRTGVFLEELRILGLLLTGGHVDGLHHLDHEITSTGDAVDDIGEAFTAAIVGGGESDGVRDEGQEGEGGGVYHGDRSKAEVGAEVGGYQANGVVDCLISAIPLDVGVGEDATTLGVANKVNLGSARALQNHVDEFPKSLGGRVEVTFEGERRLCELIAHGCKRRTVVEGVDAVSAPG